MVLAPLPTSQVWISSFPPNSPAGASVPPGTANKPTAEIEELKEPTGLSPGGNPNPSDGAIVAPPLRDTDEPPEALPVEEEDGDTARDGG